MVLSTWSFGLRGNAAAWGILNGGGRAVDAVEQACRIIEIDPEVDSVGIGGLPDRDGRVSLDGCIMLGPRQCGSVAALRRHVHPVSVARAVMENTPHVMLVGDEADRFADEHGFDSQDLLSTEARQQWEQWKRDAKMPDQSRDRHDRPPRPIDAGAGSERGAGRLFYHADELRFRHHDTIGVLALDSQGTIAAGCSTSGTPFKLPGRVGDSPIIGQGLYVDPAAGAATATGTGELIMGVCGSFLVVELMRRGLAPINALRETLQRIIDSYDLQPHHQVAIIALRPDGAWASAALRPGYLTSITTSERNEAVAPDAVMRPG